MDYTSLGIAMGIPVLRSIFGWAENALEDGKIEAFEWRKLGSTVLRVGFVSACIYLGYSEMIGPIAPYAAAAGGALVDMMLKKLKGYIPL